jgi:hypothetical protein
MNNPSIQATLEHLDAVAEEMEAKWGVDRLPHLVGKDLREKFLAQQAYTDSAIAAHDHTTIPAAEAMERAWRTLDTVAMADGQLTAIHRVWQTTMPDGRVLAVAKDRRSYKAVKADVFMTIDEVAQVVVGMPDLVAKAKAAFPGATITGVSDFDFEVGDEVPF